MSIIKAQQALKQMRELSENGIPFSLVHYKYSDRNGANTEIKEVNNCLLRKGIIDSDKSEVLIAYEDLDRQELRQCYLPLIIKYNNTCLI